MKKFKIGEAIVLNIETSTDSSTKRIRIKYSFDYPRDKEHNSLIHLSDLREQTVAALVYQNHLLNGQFVQIPELIEVMEDILVVPSQFDWGDRGARSVRSDITELSKYNYWKDLIEKNGDHGGYRIKYTEITDEESDPNINDNKESSFRNRIDDSAVGLLTNSMGEFDRVEFKKYRPSRNNNYSILTDRYSYLDEIISEFKRLKRPEAKCLYSEGGYGKTTSALYIADSLYDNYERIIWVNYNDSLDKSLLLALESDGISKDSEEDRLESIRASLLNPHAPKTMIVIDNVDKDAFVVDEGYLNIKLLRQESTADILITTRVPKSVQTSPALESLSFDWCFIEPLTAKDGITLFKKFYNLDRTVNDETTIKDIVKAAYNNPLLIEIIAKSANYVLRRDSINLEEYYERVFANGFVWDDTGLEISTNYTSVKSIESILKSVYSLNCLTDVEQEIVWSFTILPPNIYLSADEINRVLRCSVEQVESLHDKGWLIYNPKEGYRTHDIVRDFIWINHDDNHVKKGKTPDDNLICSYSYKSNDEGFAPCHAFNPSWEDFLATNDSYNQTEKMVQVLKACGKYLKITNEDASKLLYTIAHASFYGLGNKKEAEQYYKKAIVYASSDNQKMIMQLYYEYSYLLSSMSSNRYSESVEIMNSAFSLISEYSREEKCDSLEYLLAGNLGHDILWESFMAQLSLDSFILDNKGVAPSWVGYRFGSIDSLRMYARIIDHYGYIITIHNPARYQIAEELLKVAIYIRRYLFGINELEEDSEEGYDKYVYPFSSVINEHIDKDDYSFFGTAASVFMRCKNGSKTIIDNKVIVEGMRVLSGCDYIHDLQDLATSEDNLGYLLSHCDKTRFDEAECLLKSALNHRRELEALDQGKHLSELSWTLDNYASLLTVIGGKENLAEAKELYTEAIKYRSILCDMTNGKYRDNKAWSLLGLYRCSVLQGDNSNAERYYNEAKQLIEELLSENDDYKSDYDYILSLKNMKKVLPIIGNQSHYTKDIDDINKKLIALYVDGVKEEQIVSMMKWVYGIDIDASFVSEVVTSIIPSVISWMSRPLEEVYPIVYIDKCCALVDSVEVDVYILTGINQVGDEIALSVEICDKGEGLNWTSVFSRIKSRGVRDILIICNVSGESLKRIIETVCDIYPDVDYCDLRSFLLGMMKGLSANDSALLLSDLRKVYMASDENSAMELMNNVKAKWSLRIPEFYSRVKATVLFNDFKLIYKFSTGIRCNVFLHSEITYPHNNYPDRRVLIYMIIEKSKDLPTTISLIWGDVYPELLQLYGDRLPPIS